MASTASWAGTGFVAGSITCAAWCQILPCLLAVAGLARAQSTNEVSFDRPGIAFGTAVLERGGVAWEQGLPDFSSDRDDELHRRDYVLGSRLRLGLGGNLEVQLAADTYAWQHQSDGHARGSGDSSVSLKLALPSRREGFGWALLASYGLPSGEPPFAADAPSRELGATFAWDLPQGRGLALYVDWLDDGDGQTWTFSPGYTLYSGERLGGYIEAGFSRGADEQNLAGGGMTWRAAPRVQLDLSLLHGLDRASPDWQGGFGVSVALR